MNKTTINNKYNNFSYLFHKYILKLSDPNEQITYLKITKSKSELNFTTFKFYLHIHCFNIDLINIYFNTIINNFSNKFGIIITYCEGLNDNINIDNSVLLKIINKGADIGAKINAINYLQINSINYEYVLFVHYCEVQYKCQQNHLL